MPTAPFHTPVLLPETLSFLAPGPGGTYVDATLGGGGHAEAILGRIDRTGRCIGIDADIDALTASAERLKQFGNRFVPVRENFGNLKRVLSQLGIRTISGIVFDLGVSSHQLDDPSRGFSFRGDEVLDMRMDRHQTLGALAVVNSYEEAALAGIIRSFGEERFARRIAGRIVSRRAEKPIETTGALAKIVDEAVGHGHAVKSRARVFQAIRIEVNKELDRLREGLSDAETALEPGGRMVVISYHSLEDRIVKSFLRDASKSVERSGVKLVPDRPLAPTLRILTRKPVEASKAEREKNPRSRSAKLRAAEKL